ncbi:hypothetical protein DIPPA_10888 [Diplonema papillatum]|nr:hypothetical protein DIPPA_10888 [Diplonema papillatum]
MSEHLDSMREQLADAFTNTCRYSQYSSNRVENHNNVVMKAREARSVIESFELLRDYTQGLFTRRRELLVIFRQDALVPKAGFKLGRLISAAANDWTVKVTTTGKMQVSRSAAPREREAVTVGNDGKFTCTCMETARVTGFPCVHAVAAIQATRPKELPSYVPDVFKVSAYRQVYSREVPALPTLHLKPDEGALARSG